MALALVDEIGRDAFSMRKLGAELGVDPMAVYRYFDDQEALFDGIAEAIFAELDVDTLPWDGPWRDLVEQYSVRLRDALLAHPHAVAIFATRPLRSPAAIATGVRTVELMTGAGFAAGDALRILRCLREFTVGHALGLAVLRLGGRRRSRKPAPDAPEYNLLARGADEADDGDHFAPGLAAMLDGFADPAGRSGDARAPRPPRT
ncbi:TetR/AcrR family transcriptional regulator C-terminal domain-containing protein [Pseudonocardia humida]|uniref:TetR/AcrR family transcriptional regulator C-terminal domain-containing protein n=1 Tax=Pseudonocardia humida TaxID=2800819 RepID=A0ABT0ZZ25_9PSEU|nr:TetR/AcrR family transcriptional regulator C-terminal domain-containing protein [Pseudonocardia humida]MCO1655987.1 TetR/AcrR family transcriptional regulator C-terminal domain-containing protein [Pseudonocardia humida]